MSLDADATDVTEGVETPDVLPDVPEVTSAAFEFETELQVADAAEQLGTVPELRPDVWDTLAAPERLAALDAVEQRMASIQDRPAVPLVVKDLGPGLFGSYHDGVITLNAEHIDGSMPVQEMVDTVVHEGRHAFQQYAIEHPELVADGSTVAAWADNMQPGGYVTAELYGQQAYESQPVEADAWEYGRRVRTALYGANA